MDLTSLGAVHFLLSEVVEELLFLRADTLLELVQIKHFIIK